MRLAILVSCVSMKSWPEWEYFDAPPDVVSVNARSSVRSLLAKKDGYQFSPANCPGFEYKQEDQALVVDCFAGKPQWVDDHTLPKEWQGLVYVRIEQIEKEREERAMSFHLPHTTYLIVDSMLGTYVAQGE